MKKGLKVVGVVFGGFILLGIGAAIGGGNDDPGTKVESQKTVQQAPKKETKAPAPKEEKKESKVFAFGQEVTFDSGLSVKPISVAKTTERNQFADPTKYVLVVKAEITNTTDAEVFVTSYDLNVQDKDGFQGETYPGGDQDVTIAPHGKARVSFQYAIDGEGPYKVLAGDATWK